MKLSSKKENKVKIIEIIKGFFDEKFIEEAALFTKFVQRESKLQNPVNLTTAIRFKLTT